MFLGQKLHATVLACVNRVPSVMIEYRPKCRDFMASLDLERYVIRTDEFRAQSAAAMIEELRLERDVVVEALRQGVAGYRARQEAVARALTELLVGRRTML